MIKLFLLIVFSITHIFLFSQEVENGDYSKLDTIQIYQVDIEYSSSLGGKDEYLVNGIEVDKQTFDKYNSFEKTQNCCPCVYELLTINETLISRSTECNSCKVGDYTTYYSNGNIQCQGKYKQNNTEDWNSLYYRGLCDIKTGEWIYFDSIGDTLYIEKWNDGMFISQDPDQNSDDIWGIDFMLNGIIIYEEEITVKEFNQLLITPKYKSNKAHPSPNLSFDLSIHTSPKNGILFKDLSFTDLPNIDLIGSTQSTNIEKEKITFIYLSIYSNDKLIVDKKINIK